MKIDYVKIENDLAGTLLQLLINRLNELASLADMIKGNKKLTKTVSKVVSSFKNELTRIQKKDGALFDCLDIDPEFLFRISRPIEEFSELEWSQILQLKDRIEELKKELRGKEVTTPEDDRRIEHERKRHVNKRFNVRDNWLPLK